MNSLTLLVPSFFICRFLWSSLRQYLIRRETGFHDAEFVRHSRPKRDRIPGTVVICGGSISGLLAARACANHFESVVIVEAESWLNTEDAIKVQSWTQEHTRSRIMQYTSIQGNLAMLYRGLANMFPNLDDECVASDIGDYGGNFFGHILSPPYTQYGGTLPKTLFASRKALETLLRRLVFTSKGHHSDIQQIIGTITGVRADALQPDRLSEVLVRTSDGSSVIKAALVVDCTGPTQGGSKWIQRVGFGNSLATLKESFDANMHYTTFCFQISPELGAKLPIPRGFKHPCGGIMTLFPDVSRDNRYISAVKAEGNSIYVACGSWGGDETPKSLEGIKPFAQSIKVDKALPEWFLEFLDLLGEAEETMIVSAVRVAPSFWTHYERAPDLPSNWIALGDSVSRVNPLYGQGCTKALLDVLAMNTILHENSSLPALPDNFSKRFFQAQAARMDPLWQSTKTLDYAQGTTVPVNGESLRSGWFVRWYIRYLQMLCETDIQAGKLCANLSVAFGSKKRLDF
ncbi:hypothetical protein BDZ89DRAFT_26674 [Hymenopellis radicata]|nr:hypothetical protein BDZ89DRAFT_26674 [Hymenopellis radicata]